MPLDKDAQREYMRARRAREKAMREIGQDDPVTPGEHEVAAEERGVLSLTDISTVNLESTLKRQRGRKLKGTTDGERLGDGETRRAC